MCDECGCQGRAGRWYGRKRHRFDVSLWLTGVIRYLMMLVYTDAERFIARTGSAAVDPPVALDSTLPILVALS